jgi:hypothetical protein
MSNYSFTQPIRYYKANDPYYYEVDNIPLRQLEENVLYLKEQITGTGDGDDDGGDSGGGFLTENSELDVTNIKQLRPRFQAGRTVRVNAGKFNARVNDAYNITNPLYQLVRSSLDGQGESAAGAEPIVIPNFSIDWSSTDISDVWQSFIDGTSDTAFNMNGLETAYTFHQTPGSLGGQWMTVTAADMGITTGEGSENFPHYGNADAATTSRWPFQTQGPLTPPMLLSEFGYANDYRFSKLQDIHLAFVNVWRSVFRTAVVDFPQSSIEVPSWNDDDFYYYDSNGTKVQIDYAQQRIDLLFAYAMPIDVSATTVNDYTSGFSDPATGLTPKTITAPQLGILRGAGVGVQMNDDDTRIFTREGEGDPGEAGSKRILANINDASSTGQYGITDRDGNTIHGSFPSPDDLLNQAANLAVSSSADPTQLQLIGQSVLPIAYIVVKKGQQQLTDADIIDIRPFLRTAELGYNERAGIGAANPPLSFSNPAVGAYQLKDVVEKTYQKIDSLNTDGQSTNLGKPIYMDYVMGGLAYGVEGTMLTMNNNSVDVTDPWGSETQTASRNGYSFATYTGSKPFLEDATHDRRRAYLEYVFNSRQDDLKRWLSDVNQSNNASNYLNLSTFRRIPLFPEWDPTFDTTNSNEVQNAMNYQSADPTFWMWLEGLGKTRALRYAPGGPPAPTETNTATSDLTNKYMPGYGDTDAQGFYQSCMKEYQINFPSWVIDYDVIVEYINCSPYGAQIANNATTNQLVLGTGLSVNKGPMVYTGGDRFAKFSITSMAAGLPETVDGMVYQGKLLDQYGNEDLGGGKSPIVDKLYQWLSYTVSLANQRETQWRTGPQASFGNESFRRFTPKLGAAFYPTVKFTVIGYPITPYNQNLNYQQGGANNQQRTAIPDNLSVGDQTTFTSSVPVYDRTVIDIPNLEY